MALSALQIVQSYYPGVIKVKDATKNINITVTKDDCFKGTKKAPNKCAMANAFQHHKDGVDGAIISRSISYLIRGDQAIRYKTPESVAREIISFDRGQDFDPGDYSLKAPSGMGKLGVMHSAPPAKSPKRNSGGMKNHYHKTTGVRVL